MRKIFATIITLCTVLCMFTGCGELKGTSISTEEKKSGYVWGIDISRYQEKLTDDFFVKLKNAGCKFIYIQFGLTNYPATADAPILDFSEIACRFADQAELNEIHFGFYYLTEATTSLYRQAETTFILSFLKDIEAKNYKYNKLPLMLDHEVLGTEADLNGKIEQFAAQVEALKLFDVETIIYTSETRYATLNTKLPEQNFWIANYNYVNETGIAPEKNPELIPDFLKSDNNIKMWQYASDSSILGERFESITKEELAQNMPIDRNLMSIDFYEKLIK